MSSMLSPSVPAAMSSLLSTMPGLSGYSGEVASTVPETVETVVPGVLSQEQTSGVSGEDPSATRVLRVRPTAGYQIEFQPSRGQDSLRQESVIPPSAFRRPPVAVHSPVDMDSIVPTVVHAPRSRSPMRHY